ncbi:MAG: anti-sigma factor antagonist [Planctomycetota bacterium]|nr:MAG: anti-sigma factor antagonist [Planctomycetota bacterium]
MAEKQPHLTYQERNGVTVVEFADRKILDELCIHEIQSELDDIVEGVRGIRLLLSFKNVEHLSSAALGVLIRLNKRVAEQGGTLKLSDISPPIYEVFKITRLNKLFDIHETADEALAAF